MTERVKFQADGGSPLRISVSGVDVNSAQFSDLIFDGNQQPLRLWGTGYLAVFSIDFFNSRTIMTATGPLVLATPSGTTPMFKVLSRNDHQSSVAVPTTPGAHVLGRAPGGGSVSNVDGGGNRFVGINVARDAVQGGGSPEETVPIYVAYAILRNIQ